MRQALFRRFDTRRYSAHSFAAKLVRAALVGIPLVAGGAGTQAQTLASLPNPGFSLDAGGPARPIAAWVKFCEQFASECSVSTSEAAVIALTPQTWNLIVSINRRVNNTVKPIT